MSTYLVSIGCVLYMRLTSPHRLPPARWRLGHISGILVNSGGLAYSAFVFFWCFWPTTVVQTLDDVNQAVAIFVGVFVCAPVMYAVKGRRSYRLPELDVVGRGADT